MTPEQKAWIDGASYEQLLEKWRFTPIGDAYFQDAELAAYFKTIMRTKRQMEPDGGVGASKRLGWTR